ncbi:MAG: hypothetical protein GXP47_02730, partial [Acidobacteria bacterium]|nr:hypothetical protein [Acidobacteriota bacterium]
MKHRARGAFELWVAASHTPVRVPAATTRGENTETLTVELLECPPGVQGRDGCKVVEHGRIALDFLNAPSLPFVTLGGLVGSGGSFTTTIRTIDPSLTPVDLRALRGSAGGTPVPSIQLRVRGWVNGVREPVADGLAEIPLDLGPVGGAGGGKAPPVPPAPAAAAGAAGVAKVSSASAAGGA